MDISNWTRNRKRLTQILFLKTAIAKGFLGRKTLVLLEICQNYFQLHIEPNFQAVRGVTYVKILKMGEGN